MKPLENFADKIAIVVSSCDPFFDAWRPFAQFFRKFWDDCPFPVFLVVNELDARSSWIHPIRVGPDPTWGRKLIKALRQIPQSHIIYFQEDYFLTSRVDEKLMAEDLTYALENNVDSFSFRARSNREPDFEFINERFGVVPANSDGRTRCQATLWKRESLLSILREKESVWDFEMHGSERTRQQRILSYGTCKGTPINYTMSAIVRGLWMPEAIVLCGQHDIKIRPLLRGIYSENRWLRRIRRALTRRRIERALRRNPHAIIDLDRE